MQGHLSLTKEQLYFLIELHTYKLNLADYTTTVNEKQNCFYDIYFPREDGSLLRIRLADWVENKGQIWLIFDEELLAIFVRPTAEENEQQ